MTAMLLLGNNLPELNLQAHNCWKKPLLPVVANLTSCMFSRRVCTNAHKHMVVSEKTHMHTVHAYMNFQVQSSRKKRLY